MTAHTRTVVALLAAILPALASSSLSSPPSVPPRTWSGGQAGVDLNSTELDIYSVASDSGGWLTHFWVTGGDKHNIDNAILTIYVDGRADIQHQVNMGSGTGWVDDTTPCTLGNCPEKNSAWGNQWIGKGSGMGGWYNNLQIPFQKTLSATLRSAVGACNRTTPPGGGCNKIPNVDLFGNDLPNGEHNSVTSFDACCALCDATDGCTAFTWHSIDNRSIPVVKDSCFLKRAGGPGMGRVTVGAFGGWVDAESSLTGVDFLGADVGAAPGVASPAECARACKSHSQCTHYTYYGSGGGVGGQQDPTCLLKNASSGSTPTNTTVVSGPVPCGNGVQDASVFTLIRGVYGRASIQPSISGMAVPPTARFVSQQNSRMLEPLDYYDLVSLPPSTAPNGGLVLMTTLSVASGDANFMEGCFHLYAPQNATFPGEIMATGTEDYYDSGYYFIDAYPLHLPSTGFTFQEQLANFSVWQHGAMKWSTYRMHTVDQLAFGPGGASLTWRNGDVALPGVGKCRFESRGPPVGSPTNSFVRSLAFAYVW